MKSVMKLTLRSIRTFIGRYMALLLIVALSVGFFAGLKITESAMTNTGEEFLEQQAFYDFRLFSTLGFTDADVERFAALSGVEAAEGGCAVDALITGGENTHPFTLLALPEQVNRPALVAGRLPQSKTECLADDERFDETAIGTTLRLSEENDKAVTTLLDGEEFTIVGLVDSPLYIGLDRGTTGIGNGAIYAYLYLPADCFAGDVYTEISLTLEENAAIYSAAYDELIEAHEAEVAALCEQLAGERYDDLLAESGLTPEMAAQFGITAPQTYVLTREENAGYVSFENDTAIVSGIANIFPLFFILIAMLVCITTMTRMVDEERTQIGVLKALGFGRGAIMAKYLLYAGSATLIGWAVGFFVCTWGLPQVFWFAYNALYDFAPLSYLFRPRLAVLTLAVALVGILGSTFLSCRRELGSVPARLIRPRAAKKGKRILLERVGPLWKRLTFLQKITLRNMFRYKQRLVMMLVGISCCAGLLVTAFGVWDSMIHIGTLQFEQIQKYDIEAAFEAGDEALVREKLDALESVSGYQTASVHRVDVSGKETVNSVTLMSFRETEGLADFFDFHSGEEPVAYPGRGEAIVNTKVAERLSLSVGDTVDLRDADMRTATVTVSGIFDNYIYNFVIVSEDTFTDAFGEWQANTALLSIDGDIEDAAHTLTGMAEITGVSRLASTKETVDSALSCLNYIVLLIVLFSGALAFIVIFNLTNINLAERSREIATVEVLGFYPRETESYVLRENLVLSILASVIGLPLGTLFHRVVMSMIVVDFFAFDVRITPVSYLLAFVCTVLFAVVVNLFMKRQIGKIRMAESLKAVE